MDDEGPPKRETFFDQWMVNVGLPLRPLNLKSISFGSYNLLSEECKPAFSIHSGTSFYDVVKHVQTTAAVLKNGLACLNRNESLFRVSVIPVIPAHPEHFLLVVSLNHTIGNWESNEFSIFLAFDFPNQFLVSNINECCIANVVNQPIQSTLKRGRHDWLEAMASPSTNSVGCWILRHLDQDPDPFGVVLILPHILNQMFSHQRNRDISD